MHHMRSCLPSLNVAMYLASAMVQILKDYDEQRIIVQNIPVAKNTSEQRIVSAEIGSNKAMKKSFVMTERKEENYRCCGLQR